MDSSSSPTAPPVPQPPARSGPSLGLKLLLGCGAGCTLMFALVIGVVGFIAWKMGTGAWPDTVVTKGEDLPAFVEELLVDNQVIEPGEKILYFYSAAFTDYLDDGNVLTDRRVISYEKSDGELDIDSATFAEVIEIDPEYGQDLLDDTLLMVETEDDFFYLLLSSEEDMDEVFVRELKKQVEAAH